MRRMLPKWGLTRRSPDSFLLLCASHPVLSGCVLFLALLTLTGELEASVRFLILGVLLALSLVGALFFFAVSKKLFLQCMVLVFLSCFAAAYVEYAAYRSAELPARQLIEAGEKADVSGYIKEVLNQDEESASVILQTETAGGKAQKVKIQILIYNNSFPVGEIRAGDRVSGTVTLSLPHRDLWISDQSANLKKNGAFLYGTLSEDAEWVTGKASVPFWETIRETARGLLAQAKSEGLLLSALLGDNSELSSSFSKALSGIGCSHLFALSGLHLTLIIGSLYRFLEYLSVRRQVNLVINLCFCALYILVAGAPLSLLRAGGMLFLYDLCLLFRKRTSTVTNLFFSVCLIGLFDRYALFDFALRLSFLSTLGILLCVPMLERQLKSRVFFRTMAQKKLTGFWKAAVRFVVISFEATIAALFFAFPVLALQFSYLPLLAPFYNLIFLLLFQPALIFAMLFLLFAAAKVPILASLFCTVTDALFSALNEVVLFFGRIEFGRVFVNTPYLFVVILCMLACVLICLWFRIRALFISIVPLICAACFLFTGGIFQLLHQGDQSLFCMNFYQDQRLILKTDDSAVILEGAASQSGFRASVFSGICARLQIESVGAIVLPSLRRGTVNFLDAVSEAITIETLYVPKETLESDPDLYSELIYLCDQKGIALLQYEFGKTLCFGDSFSVSPHARSANAFDYEIETAGVCISYGNNLRATGEADTEKSYDIVLQIGKSGYFGTAIELSKVAAAYGDQFSLKGAGTRIDLNTVRTLLLTLSANGKISVQT